MVWDNKVVWSEGMFLRSHHFQQSDRYVEMLVRAAIGGLRGNAWGLGTIEIDSTLLGSGKFAIARADGLFQDGTPFAVPETADHPAPIDIPDSTRDDIVYLMIPARRMNGIEVAGSTDTETPARYRRHEYEARDVNAGFEGAATVEVGRPSLRLGLERDDRGGYLCIGLARIREVRADKRVVLDEQYIPPCLHHTASTVLAGFMTELQGLLHQRGEALAGRVSESGARGAAEIADFLLLQAVNRYQPMVTHVQSSLALHPEDLFALAVEMAGELSTFTATTKRPPSFPAYQHDNLQQSFAPVIRQLRQSLSAVLEQTAVPIPLQERRYGIRVGVITDRTLLASAVFVLGVKAQVAPEAIRTHFPNHAKIGAVERIRDLVNAALPGIGLRPLPVAPRQIPYHAGTTYFELDRSSTYWRELAQSGGIAIHVAGDFPELEIECWAIRT